MRNRVVSSAVISAVTAKIGDAVIESTTWCSFSVPGAMDKTMKTFVASSSVVLFNSTACRPPLKYVDSWQFSIQWFMENFGLH